MKHAFLADDEDKKTKRQNILDAAFVIFSQKGFHKATVDDIIALADTGKGTVYNYFTNKEQLFFTLLDERGLKFRQQFLQSANDASEPLLKLEHMIRVQLEFFNENTSLWQIMVHELRPFSDASLLSELQRIKYCAQIDERIALFAKVIEEGRQAGVINYPDAQRAASMLFSIIIGTAFSTCGDFEVEDRLISIRDLVFHGIAQ
jgi:AcrR family transcriptional regulator